MISCHSSWYCSGGGGGATTSVCDGDSGGPLIANDFAADSGPPIEIGVIDSSDDCSTQRPNYFARVDPFYAWAQQMIQDELELYETLLTKVESDDRVSRKRLERLKEGLKEASAAS